MKENPIPTRDLRTGAKVVYLVGEGIFEAIKPHLKYYAMRKVEKVLRLVEGK